MRTNVEIDDELLEKARASGNFKTKKETIEAGLRSLVRLRAIEDLEEVCGPDMFFEDYDYKAMRAAD
ncbi:MAG: type II toxin-antitoxin system VapB family antitoxin [Dehalococcoidia bacterium]